MDTRHRMILACIKELQEELYKDKDSWEKMRNFDVGGRCLVLSQIDNELCTLDHIETLIRGTF